MLLLLALLPLCAAAPSECAERVSADALRQALGEARAAWVAMDRAAFTAATARRRALLPCVGELLPPEVALDLHLGEALSASLARDQDAELGAFRAILTLAPGWALPLDVAPAGHRLHTEFAAARSAWSPVADRSVTPEPDTSLWVDGRIATALPADRPYLLQVAGPDLGVRSSRYAEPGDALDLAHAPPAVDMRVGAEEPLGPAPTRRRTGGLLLGGAGGLGLLAGGLYAVAAARAAEMDRGEVACERLDETREQVNSLVVAAAGTGTAALGLGVGGLVVRF